MANNTLQEVQDEVFNIFVENEQSGDFWVDNVTRKIKSVYARFCSGSITRLFADPATWAKTINIKRLPFLEKKTVINRKQPTYTTATAVAWATSIDMDTTNLSTAGYVICKGNVIKYTNKTSTSLTWVTGLVVDLEIGDQVSQTFLISDVNVFKPFDLTYFCIDTELHATYRAWNDPKPSEYFTILNENGDRFLQMVGYGEWSYRLYYVKTPDDLATPATELELPGDAGIDIIAPLVAWEILWKNEETGFAQEKLTLAYNAAIEFADKYARDIKEEVPQIEFSWVSVYDVL